MERSPQEAQAELAEAWQADWRAACRGQLATLRQPLREAGVALIDTPLSPARLPPAEEMIHAVALERAEAEERLGLLRILLPRIASWLERSWEPAKGLPYGVGPRRRGFRTPGQPWTSLPARWLWLKTLVQQLGGYADPAHDLAWLAGYAGHFPRSARGAEALGLVLATAINTGDREGEAVLRALNDTALGDHPVGVFGPHVVRGLLLTRPEDRRWQGLLSLLVTSGQVSAGDSTALRQAILEEADTVWPGAFGAILLHIEELGLHRFSATVRALNVWLGYQWSATQRDEVFEAFEHLREAWAAVEANATAEAWEPMTSPRRTYAGLWALAIRDAAAAVSAATELATDRRVPHRFVAARMLQQLSLQSGRPALIELLKDPDARVRAVAAEAFDEEAFSLPVWEPGMGPAAGRRWAGLRRDNGDVARVFDAMRVHVDDQPERPASLERLVWPWGCGEVGAREWAKILRQHTPASRVAALLDCADVVPAEELRALGRTLAGRSRWPTGLRARLLALVGDANPARRAVGLLALSGRRLSEGELRTAEGLLSRQALDLREGVIGLIAAQPRRRAVASVGRLLADPLAARRAAGLAVLTQRHQQAGLNPNERAQLRDYDRRYPQPTFAERLWRARLPDHDAGPGSAAAEPTPPSLDNALGLLHPDDRPAPPPLAALTPQSPPARFTPAAAQALVELDALLHAHRREPLPVRKDVVAAEPRLLAEITWLAYPDGAGTPPGWPLWQRWARDRSLASRDADGLELWRAEALLSLPAAPPPRQDVPNDADQAERRLAEHVFGPVRCPELRYAHLIGPILAWLTHRDPPEGSAAFLVEAAASTLHGIMRHFAASDRSVDDSGETGAVALDPSAAPGWRGGGRGPLGVWLRMGHRFQHTNPEAFRPETRRRWWGLNRWLDEPHRADPTGFATAPTRQRPPLPLILAALGDGDASRADLLDALLGPRSQHLPRFRALSELTDPNPQPELRQVMTPVVVELVHLARDRVIELEVQRGERPGPSTQPALDLRDAGGLRQLLVLLRALGDDPLPRSAWAQGEGRREVLGQLIRLTQPGSEDVPRHAGRELAQASPRNTLLALALANPAWAGHVQHALAWPALAEAVGWIHAHTRGEVWAERPDARHAWQIQAMEHLTVEREELADGAVDVAWFRHLLVQMGEEAWDLLDAVLPYAAPGRGYERARGAADAMLGRLRARRLVRAALDRGQTEALQQFALRPIRHDDDLLRRYRLIHQFREPAAHAGGRSERGANTRAVEIALENLAQNGGFTDRDRLRYHCERLDNAGLKGPKVRLDADETRVVFRLGKSWRLRQRVYQREVSGKLRRAKAVPKALRRDPRYQGVRRRGQRLAQQVRRLRQALEQAMCLGSRLFPEELRALCRHPVAGPICRRLVFVGRGIVGYPVGEGAALQDCDGHREPITPGEHLRLAHCHDLFVAERWSDWQRECVRQHRVQPFKQVFRELYPLTEAEREAGHASRRYVGQQVLTAQALALLHHCGWRLQPSGHARRRFPHQRLEAWLSFVQPMGSPAEVEGLTCDEAWFTATRDMDPLPLEQVPPLLFSEAMRDLDLVVSQAHASGQAPEPTTGTRQLRRQLIHQTCQALHLDNVTLSDERAFIVGRFAEYSVHLGSGATYCWPRGELIMIPVSGQHRGRLFLPFADEDPRSAEVLSKVLLLARDHEIRDPDLLAQIRGER